MHRFGYLTAADCGVEVQDLHSLACLEAGKVDFKHCSFAFWGNANQAESVVRAMTKRKQCSASVELDLGTKMMWEREKHKLIISCKFGICTRTYE
eukprot:UN27467